MRNRSLAVLSLGCLLLSSCEDKYVVDSRRAVSKMGIEGVHKYFQKSINTDDGDTYYAYYIVVNKYSEFLPENKFRDVEFQNNILSCSARFGSLRGLSDVFEQFGQNYYRIPVERIKRCTEIKDRSSRNWVECGGADLMERIPCKDLQG